MFEKRKYENISGYLYSNNDPIEKKRKTEGERQIDYLNSLVENEDNKKLESMYALWKSKKIDKYSKNNIELLDYFKEKGFDFNKIYGSPYNTNIILNSRIKYFHNNIELQTILYILIVKLKDNTYKLKIGSTSVINEIKMNDYNLNYKTMKINNVRTSDRDNSLLGNYLERLLTHCTDYDEIYYFMVLPISGRDKEEKFHKFMEQNHKDLIIKDAYNKIKGPLKEIYELNPTVVNICLNYLEIDYRI